MSPRLYCQRSFARFFIRPSAAHTSRFHHTMCEECACSPQRRVRRVMDPSDEVLTSHGSRLVVDRVGRAMPRLYVLAKFTIFAALLCLPVLGSCADVPHSSASRPAVAHLLHADSSEASTRHSRKSTTLAVVSPRANLACLCFANHSTKHLIRGTRALESFRMC